MFYLTKFDDVIWSGFWVIPKITSATLCNPIDDITNYSLFFCLFESWKCGKEGEKLQKLEYLENEKSFLDEIKNIFHSFWRAIIWWKNKKLIKNSGHKLLVAVKGLKIQWYLLSWRSSKLAWRQILLGSENWNFRNVTFAQ